MQLINVLSQIAFGYVLCFLILQVRFTVAGGDCRALMLVGQWVLFVGVPWTAGSVLTSGQRWPGD